MKDESSRDRSAQPWHPADEKKPEPRKAGSPIGTHSLTGGGAEVGMPQARASDGKPERSEPREPREAQEPDALAEPRANIGEILGRKP